MKKMKIFLFLLCSTTAIFGQTGRPAIDQLITQGDFTDAQSAIDQLLIRPDLPDTARWNLQLQRELLDRIRLDFNRDEDYVRKTLQPYFPELTDQQIETWEQSGALEMRIIDGQKRYFRNAVWNLFRIDSIARQKRIAVEGETTDQLTSFLNRHLPAVVHAARSRDQRFVKPVRFTITYTLTVDADAVPAGEILRAWLPFPRPNGERLNEVNLLTTSEPHFVRSPAEVAHQTLYLEKAAHAGTPTVFRYEAEYTARNEWRDLMGTTAAPYDTTQTDFQIFTSERPPHIRFTPAIRQLSEQIIGEETDPVKKAWLLFQWIGAHIPWTSALEYSTIPSLPQYCLQHGRGDCGIKSLLFITLCRYNGIPAKWQSGWFLYPPAINLHDWAEVYFEGIGWAPVDPDFNLQQTGDPLADRFFFGSTDAYRLIVNDDFSGRFFPAKIYPRSETVDFQRGEVEWRGGNLYFDQWQYDMSVEYEERSDVKNGKE